MDASRRESSICSSGIIPLSMYLMIIPSDVLTSISRHKLITLSRYDVTGSSWACLRCFSSATFLWIALVERYLLQKAVSKSDHRLKSDSFSSNHVAAACVNLPRTISAGILLDLRFRSGSRICLIDEKLIRSLWLLTIDWIWRRRFRMTSSVRGFCSSLYLMRGSQSC